MPFALFDHPFNLGEGFPVPSMNQSLYLTKNTAQAAHSLIVSGITSSEIPAPRFVIPLSLAAFDILYEYLPPGYAWLHEEWHRAVMSRRGISSFNDVYRFELFADTIAVSRVSDEKLAQLKDRHPAEMVRLSATGYEAEMSLIRAMRADCFFTGRPVYYDLLSWWLTTINAIAYIDVCTSHEADRITDRANREDGADIRRRDFTGLDFTAWVYDLFRPDEPYAARGVHPSGAGVDRYVKYSDLTPQERHYLKLQRSLSLLNFISPQMFGIDRFPAPGRFDQGGASWNFAVSHFLTPFGYSLDTALLLMGGDIRLCVIGRFYANKSRAFPGFEAALVRYPLELRGFRVTAGFTLALWMQPEGQRFRTAAASPGGLLRVNAAIPIAERAEWFVQPEAKSFGWAAGVVYLEEALQVSTGVNWLF
jgi:hypothetical protein